MNQSRQRKICYILAYKDPAYIRSKVLLAALRKDKNNQVIEVVNQNRGLLRYLEVIVGLLYTRISKKPDVYILGFRGHEMLPIVRLLTAGKPLVFDEFLNMQEWLTTEKKKIKPSSLLSYIAKYYMKLNLSMVQLILADTKLHAKSSSKSYGIAISKYLDVYVGADEDVFHPRASKVSNTDLEVFFYGNMAPLHGISYILKAAQQVKDLPIHFTIVGGKGNKKMIDAIREAKAEHGLKVSHKLWIPYAKLADAIAQSDICLGGPFGNTPQANRVITGKTFQFLAMAKPTIVGKIKQQDGFIDKVNCFHVRQGSAREISDILIWAAKNRRKLPKIGAEGRKLYMQKFSTEKISDKLNKAIAAL